MMNQWWKLSSTVLNKTEGKNTVGENYYYSSDQEL
jgi:hypothetical protein